MEGPVAGFVIERRKLVLYLLNLDHPTGSAKAKFFIGHGFSVETPERLAAALLSHTQQIAPEVKRVGDALKLVFTGPLPTPNGTLPRVRSVWRQDRGQRDARLLTAYPR